MEINASKTRQVQGLPSLSAVTLSPETQLKLADKHRLVTTDIQQKNGAQGGRLQQMKQQLNYQAKESVYMLIISSRESALSQTSYILQYVWLMTVLLPPTSQHRSQFRLLALGDTRRFGSPRRSPGHVVPGGGNGEEF